MPSRLVLVELVEEVLRLALKRVGPLGAGLHDVGEDEQGETDQDRQHHHELDRDLCSFFHQEFGLEGHKKEPFISPFNERGYQAVKGFARSNYLMKFTRRELTDLLVSWLTISVAFAFVLGRGLLNLAGFVAAFPITLVAVGTGFIFHELAHRQVALRFGAQAAYRAWPVGLVFALFMSLTGFVFAAPGAVYIHGPHITRKQNGLISLAGPAANIGIAIIFFLVSLLVEGSFLQTLSFFTVYINVFLAAFNLLPIYPLDGSKVFAWSRVVWGLIFFPLVFILFFVL
jgi:Zn-dependent protease